MLVNTRFEYIRGHIDYIHSQFTCKMNDEIPLYSVNNCNMTHIQVELMTVI